MRLSVQCIFSLSCLLLVNGSFIISFLPSCLLTFSELLTFLSLITNLLTNLLYLPTHSLLFHFFIFRLTCSITQPFVHSITQLSINLFVCWFTHLFIYSPNYSLTQPIVHSLTCLFTPSNVYFLTQLFIHSPVCLLTTLFVHSLTLPSVTRPIIHSLNYSITDPFVHSVSYPFFHLLSC